MIVHIAKNGVPFCGFTKEPPIRWPKGHLHVWPTLLRLSSCSDCVRVALRPDPIDTPTKQ